jgi:hypothetical protein
VQCMGFNIWPWNLNEEVEVIVVTVTAWLVDRTDQSCDGVATSLITRVLCVV